MRTRELSWKGIVALTVVTGYLAMWAVKLMLAGHAMWLAECNVQKEMPDALRECFNSKHLYDREKCLRWEHVRDTWPATRVFETALEQLKMCGTVDCTEALLSTVRSFEFKVVVLFALMFLALFVWRFLSRCVGVIEDRLVVGTASATDVLKLAQALMVRKTIVSSAAATEEEDGETKRRKGEPIDD